MTPTPTQSTQDCFSYVKEQTDFIPMKELDPKDPEFNKKMLEMRKQVKQVPLSDIQEGDFVMMTDYHIGIFKDNKVQHFTKDQGEVKQSLEDITVLGDVKVFRPFRPFTPEGK